MDPFFYPPDFNFGVPTSRTASLCFLSGTLAPYYHEYRVVATVIAKFVSQFCGRKRGARVRGPIRYDAGQIVATRQAWWDRRWVTGAAIGLSGGIANGLFG